MSNSRLSILFQLYLANQARPEEKAELSALLADPDQEEEAKALMGEAWKEFVPQRPVFDSHTSQRMLRQILNQKAEEQCTEESIAPGWNYKSYIPLAASLFLMLTAGLLLFIKPAEKSKKTIPVDNSVVMNKPELDVAPGGNKAMLTLADGTQIALDDVSTGKIASQEGINITKTADGQLIYTRTDSVSSKQQFEQNQINTISTPKGGQYQVNLPDGSKVWLNAASTLKFPTRFAPDERLVELTGEAYFEIASRMGKGGQLPFKVVSAEAGKHQVVEVLGTHFNINAYANERVMKTTLIEGSVKVTNMNEQASNMLKPGQQAILKANYIKISAVDIEEVMAWKHGHFRFNNLKLPEIMKQLERWYNVEVNYADMPQTRYQGFISKNVTLSQVLDMLELTGNLSFNIKDVTNGQGKKIEINKHTNTLNQQPM